MLEKNNIFNIAIGTFGLGADRFETWSEEDNIDKEKLINNFRSEEFDSIKVD